MYKSWGFPMWLLSSSRRNFNCYQSARLCNGYMVKYVSGCFQGHGLLINCTYTATKSFWLIHMHYQYTVCGISGIPVGSRKFKGQTFESQTLEFFYHVCNSSWNPFWVWKIKGQTFEGQTLGILLSFL